MAAKKVTFRSRLADVPDEKVFWCYGGRVLKNAEELAIALREMSDETFKHHVTGQKNDFSNWVRDVIGDETLAKNLEKSTSRISAAQTVDRKLAWLKART